MMFKATFIIFQLHLYIVVASLIGGGNQSTRWKPQTCRKSHWVHVAMSGIPFLIYVYKSWSADNLFYFIQSVSEYQD